MQRRCLRRKIAHLNLDFLEVARGFVPELAHQETQKNVELSPSGSRGEWLNSSGEQLHGARDASNTLQRQSIGSLGTGTPTQDPGDKLVSNQLGGVVAEQRSDSLLWSQKQSKWYTNPVFKSGMVLQQYVGADLPTPAQVAADNADGNTDGNTEGTELHRANWSNGRGGGPSHGYGGGVSWMYTRTHARDVRQQERRLLVRRCVHRKHARIAREDGIYQQLEHLGAELKQQHRYTLQQTQQRPAAKVQVQRAQFESSREMFVVDGIRGHQSVVVVRTQLESWRPHTATPVESTAVRDAVTPTMLAERRGKRVSILNILPSLHSRSSTPSDRRRSRNAATGRSTLDWSRLLTHL